MGRTLACVERARTGDELAASELYDLVYPLMLRIVRAYHPRYTPEEDLAQTVLMKAFTKLHQFSGKVPFEHWLARVAVNTCLKELKRERVHPELRWADLSEPEERILRKLTSSAEDLPASETLAAHELVSRLLGQLSPADRLVIVLLHLEGKSVEEVCQLTGWSRPLVKVRAFRARRRMRSHLQQLLHEASP